MQSIARACRKARIGPTSRQVVFLMEAEEDQSHDDIRDSLRDAIKVGLPVGPGYWVWVVEVWDKNLKKLAADWARISDGARRRGNRRGPNRCYR